MRTTRRDVLTAGLAIPALSLKTDGAAVTSSVATAQTAARRHPLKCGVVTYNVAKDWDLPTIIANLTDVGIDGVELRTTHAHGVELSLSPAARRDVRQRFGDSAVRLVCLGSTCEYHSADPAVVRRNIEETGEWCRLARDLGCPNVKVRPNGLRKDVPAEQSLEQIGKALAECGVAAVDAGVRLQVEVHGAETQRIPNMKRILDHAGMHPGVWICWNSNPTDLRDGGLERNFTLLKDRIGHVHVHDLYDETYPYERLVHLLQDMQFDGYACAELGEETSDGVRVLRYFRGMLRQMAGMADAPTSA